MKPMDEHRLEKARVRAGFRLPLTAVWLVLLGCATSLSCHKGRSEKTSKPAVSSPAELQRSADAAKQALATTEPRLSELRAKFAALHREFDPLPPGLPGFGETRGRFYATAIGFGTLSAKLPWLSGRIDSALKSGKRAELEEIAKDIAHMREEMAQVDRIAGELSHQVQPFKKLAADKTEEFLATGKNSCE
jgi:hypothetical protein